VWALGFNLGESQTVGFGLKLGAGFRVGDGLRVGWLNGWERYLASRTCSRDTYPQSYTTKYTSIRRL